jgi:hypothetical protein
LKKKEARTSFFAKKEAKKLLLITAFEWPQFGRSKAGGIKSFLVTFFKKVTSFFASKTAIGCAPRAARLHHAVFRGPTMTET